MNKDFIPDKGSSLPRKFFLQKTGKVAKQLIGKYIVKKEKDGFLAARIVETEAYLSEGDLSSHSAPGPTKRNKVMFEKGGVLYVYKIYGIHHCANIICEDEGKGCGVLLRAVEPVLGIENMKKRRATSDIKKLCKGPGNLAKSFGFTLDDYGRSVCSRSLFIQNDQEIEENEILETKRIGISRSTELPLRYILKNSRFVSARRS